MKPRGLPAGDGLKAVHGPECHFGVGLRVGLSVCMFFVCECDHTIVGHLHKRL